MAAKARAAFHVETTVRTRADARRLVRAALNARLAACATIIAVESTFWWRGRLTADPEHLVMFKTAGAPMKRLVALIEEEHPYEVPYVSAWRLRLLPRAYAEWLHSETEATRSRSGSRPSRARR